MVKIPFQRHMMDWGFTLKNKVNICDISMKTLNSCLL